MCGEMAILRITDWQPGLKTIAMTKVIRRYAGLNLAEAKSRTEAVVKGEVVALAIPDARDAEALRVELAALGVTVSVEE
jgi:ribosomal protein L7/L12